MSLPLIPSRSMSTQWPSGTKVPNLENLPLVKCTGTGTGGAVVTDIEIGRHLYLPVPTTPPSSPAAGGAWSGASVTIAADASDLLCPLTVVSASSVGVGAMATFNYGESWAVFLRSILVEVQPENAAAGTLGLYASVSGSTCTISCANAGTASTTYKLAAWTRAT